MRKRFSFVRFSSLKRRIAGDRDPDSGNIEAHGKSRCFFMRSLSSAQLAGKLIEECMSKRDVMMSVCAGERVTHRE